MSTTTIETPMARSAALNAWPAAPVRSIMRGIAWLLSRRRLRRAIKELRALDDRTLRDIGLRRGEVEYAARYGRPLDDLDDRFRL